jgi:hypothetical protein
VLSGPGDGAMGTLHGPMFLRPFFDKISIAEKEPLIQDVVELTCIYSGKGMQEIPVVAL